MARVPLPIAETGYRSHFHQPYRPTTLPPPRAKLADIRRGDLAQTAFEAMLTGQPSDADPYHLPDKNQSHTG